MTHHIDIRRFSLRQVRGARCRGPLPKNGSDKAQERKLLLLFGRFATGGQLQMNTMRPPPDLHQARLRK